MLKLYLQLKEFIPTLNTLNIEDAMPSPSDNRKLQDLLALLEELQIVSLTLQKSETTMSMVRCLFDTVIKDLPQLTDRLSPDANIVQSDSFESGVFLLQQE